MNIAIIGAGPAGALAAARLAQAGAPVTMFDPTHPREKACGGGLTARAMALISDLVDRSDVPAVSISSVLVEPPCDSGGGPAEVGLRSGDAVSSLTIFSRAALDYALVKSAVSAGAALVTERVVDITRRQQRIMVHTTGSVYECDYVLGADGAGSIVRKKLATPFLPSEMSVAAGYFVHGVSGRSIAVQTTHAQPGYLWSFPRRDHLAVGACARAKRGITSTRLREESAAWLRRHRLDEGTTLVPYAWPIPSAGFSDAGTLRCSGDRWMLLGDAAGLVDPLTREGIYYALLSGAWAAEALRSDAARAPGVYVDRVREEIVPELGRAARLSPLFFGAGFSALLVRALQNSERIREVFADLVAGTQPYRGLRRRLLSTRQWGLAASALRLAALGPRRG